MFIALPINYLKLILHIPVTFYRRNKDLRKKQQDSEREKIAQQREIARLERELQRVSAVNRHLPPSLRPPASPRGSGGVGGGSAGALNTSSSSNAANTTANVNSSSVSSCVLVVSCYGAYSGSLRLHVRIFYWYNKQLTQWY